MTSYLIELFFVSLILTIVVELAVALLCSRVRASHSFLPAIYGKKRILLVVLVNVLTNPPAVLVCWLFRLYLPGMPEIPVQLVIEVLVVAAEAWIYRSFAKAPQCEIDHPVMLSAAANLCSWLFGVIVMMIRRSL